MKLSALDIRKQEFARVFRGYDPEEVDAFRHMLSQQWHLLTEDIRRLEQRIQDQQDKLDHYRKVEEALEEALQTAREGARQRIEHAEKKATSAVKDAETRSQSIIRDAEQRAQRIVEEAEDMRRRARRGVAEASMRRNEIVTRLRSFLTSEMDLLAGFESLEAQRAQMDPDDELLPSYETAFAASAAAGTKALADDEPAPMDTDDPVAIEDDEPVRFEDDEPVRFEDEETVSVEDDESPMHADEDPNDGPDAVMDEHSTDAASQSAADDSDDFDWDAIAAQGREIGGRGEEHEAEESGVDLDPVDTEDRYEAGAGADETDEAPSEMAESASTDEDTEPRFEAEDEIRKIRRILEDLDG